MRKPASGVGPLPRGRSDGAHIALGSMRKELDFGRRPEQSETTIS